MAARMRRNAAEREVEVTTSKGPVRGRINFCNDRTKFHSFRMIPYAHIPIGPLRFAPPVEIESWSENNVLERSLEMGFGKENLLLLNIYTPEIKDPESTKTFDRPVIVFVPGDTGCITYNTLNYHGPQFFMVQDVVLVTVCYRAGMLGFLKFDDPSLNAPGDVGYRDVKMALEWIKKEIENFGGCPNNITAYGQGYGANMIRHLLMDEKNENLFHKAILSSFFEHRINRDIVSGPDGVYIGCRATRHMIDILSDQLDLHCDTDSEYACCDFLRDVDYSMIEVAHSTFTSFYTEDFITREEIQEHLEQRYPVKVPIIIGYNSIEALIEKYMVSDNGQLNIPMFYRYLVRHGSCGVDLADEMIEYIARRRTIIISLETLHQTKIHHVPQFIKANFCSDGMYNIGVIALTRTLASEMSPKNVYFYRFAVDLGLKFSPDINLPEIGVAHGYELPYVFKLPHLNHPKSQSPEEITVKRMTMLWAQFARTGDPNPPALDEELITVKWPPVVKNLKCCFNLSKDGVEYGVIPNINRIRYWEKRTGVQFLSSFIRQNNEQDKRQSKKQEKKEEKRQEKGKSKKKGRGG